MKERPLPPIAPEKLTAMARAVLDAHAIAREPVTRAGLYRDRLGVLNRMPPRERERVIVRVMELVERPAGGEGAASPRGPRKPPAVPVPAVTAPLAIDSPQANNPVTEAVVAAPVRKPRTPQDRPRATARRLLTPAEVRALHAAIRRALEIDPGATTTDITAFARGEVPARLGPKGLQKHVGAVRRDMGIVAARTRPAQVTS